MELKKNKVKNKAKTLLNFHEQIILLMTIHKTFGFNRPGHRHFSKRLALDTPL